MTAVDDAGATPGEFSPSGGPSSCPGCATIHLVQLGLGRFDRQLIATLTGNDLTLAFLADRAKRSLLAFCRGTELFGGLPPATDKLRDEFVDFAGGDDRPLVRGPLEVQRQLVHIAAMWTTWNEIKPGSELVDCLQHLESEALKRVNELREWRRSQGAGEMEPVDVILDAFLWGSRWFEEKSDVLGADRITRLQWRGMPNEWWSTSRVAARTKDEAVMAWLQISDNAAHEIERIEKTRAFVISLSSAAVAVVALLVSGISLLVQLMLRS